MKHIEVVNNWLVGNKAIGSFSPYAESVRLKTDGNNLWSYNMLIGITLKTGEKRLLNVRVYNTLTSKSTLKHFGLAYNGIAKRATAEELPNFLVNPVLSTSSYYIGGDGFVTSGLGQYLKFPTEIIEQAL